MVDVHSPTTGGGGHIHPLWYKDHITEQIFIESWVWFAQRYRNNDTILAFDLQNEPHGKVYLQPETSARWDGSDHPNNWAKVATRTANRIQAVHPNVLIVIEGIESYPNWGKHGSTQQVDYLDAWWGANLRGVRDYPIHLNIPNRLVYSSHDYGPAVSNQPWFYKGFNKQTLDRDVWHKFWFFVVRENIAPVLIGEWGGFLDGGPNEKWQTALRDFIVENKIHHTYWCFNANSGDTGGLVLGDFTTWDEQKYSLIYPALWKSKNGRFIGLDHQVPLGSNGLSLTQFNRNQH